MIKIAVARRYAKALFGLLEVANIESTKQGLAALAQAVSESSELRQVLASPAFGYDEKRSVFTTLSQKLGAPPIVKDFVAQLIKKNRIGFLSEMAEEFTALADREKGTKQVEVTSARTLPPDEREGFQRRLRELLRHDIDLTFQTEPALLSGLQIQIGSTVFDSTVRSRLTAMRALATKE